MHAKKKRALLPLALLFVVFLAASAPAPACAQTQPPRHPESIGLFQFSSAGTKASVPELFPGEPFPQNFSTTDRNYFCQLRDETYNSAPPEAIESQATSLLQKIALFSGTEAERLLLRSRVAYYAGRCWNEHKNKKKAIPWLEHAVSIAQELLKLEGDTPRALVVYAEPLGELSILKDIAFLVMNGPKVEQSAAKALNTDPDNIRALLLKANALAYPPPIWGGNYPKALEAYAAILQSAPPSGLPPDTLFDLRVGIATAYANLKQPELARWWFNAARELFPNNIYATQKLEKLQK